MAFDRAGIPEGHLTMRFTSETITDGVSERLFKTLAEAATQVTIPVEFLLQWDDELIPRESGLALFDAFASPEKSLHANPGRHGDVPMFEVESSLRFFGRHLGADGASGVGG
jgi:fermentation-respiration switch protein FrsA (DUF1100 family)